MPDLILGFDPGSSLNKAIARVRGETTLQLVTTEPEIIAIPHDSFELFLSTRGTLGTPHPKDDAWLTLKPKAQQVQVTGFLARQFQASMRLDLLKYETALYKVLSTVGAIAQDQDLPHRFTLSLAMLLPWNEYQNRHALESQLQAALKDFTFRNVRYRASLERFDCLPEGAGVAMMRLAQNGIDWFQRQILVILMLGHRNSSILICDRGKLASGSTANLGFSHVVEVVVQRSAGQSGYDLTPFIYRAGANPKPDDECITGLLKSTIVQNQMQEAQHLVKAIVAARSMTWTKLQDWLNANLPRTATHLIVAGGDALYFKPELQQKFDSMQIDWCDDLHRRVQDLFKLDYRSHPIDRDDLAFRLIDVFSLFVDFESQLQEAA